MNNQRIVDWVDGLFAGFAQTDEVREQKEELQTHITDRVKEHMANSMDFDRAFAMAKEDLGDLDELLASFERKKGKKKVKDDTFDDEFGKKKKKKDKWGWQNQYGLVAISPFIFIGLGFAFGWWAWAWMIIPVSAILFSGSWGKKGDEYKLVALSPFIYLALGFAFGWWAWGWIIIPVPAILLGTGTFTKNKRD